MNLIQLKVALSDWNNGLKHYSLWTYLGLQDIKRRYRRSTLGPLWITVSMTIMIFAMGPLYSKIFKNELQDYILYLATGYVVWNLIVNTINELTDSFLSAEKFIKQIKLPYSVYILKIIYKNLIIFLHNTLVIILILAVYPPKYYNLIWLLPIGLLLIYINFVWIGIFISLLCTRYRDLNQIVSNVLQISFFLTPIMWKIELLGNYKELQNYNFLYHLVNVVRGPLIADPSTLYSIKVLIITSIIGSIFAFIFFAKYRSRISYWI